MRACLHLLVGTCARDGMPCISVRVRVNTSETGADAAAAPAAPAAAAAAPVLTDRAAASVAFAMTVWAIAELGRP